MSEVLELRIKQIKREHEAITVVFEEINSKPVFYHSGQFLTLIVKIGEKELRRSYSLCTSPEVDSFLAVTIKRVENGEVSRYLIDHLKEGDIIRALPPAGRFTLEIDPLKKRNIFLIGAGSGITPLFSHLKTILSKEPLSKVVLIMSNRNEKTEFYKKEIEALEARFPEKLKVLRFYSEPLYEAHPRIRLNIELLESLVRTHLSFRKEEAELFVCGPFEYMRMVRMTLIYMGFQEEQIHRENFISKIQVNETDLPTFPNRNVKLVYKSQEFILEVPSGKTILKAALENGISLPYSCQAGVCSTCTSLCRRGKIYMSHNQVLTDNEVKKGMILTCVGYPETDGVVVEVG